MVTAAFCVSNDPQIGWQGQAQGQSASLSGSAAKRRAFNKDAPADAGAEY